VPHFCEELEAVIDHSCRDGRERIQQIPDRASREPVHDLHTEVLCGMCGAHHFFRGALANVGGFAVAPNVGWEDGLVAFVDVVAYGLAHEMIADRPGLESVSREDLMTRVAIV